MKKILLSAFSFALLSVSAQSVITNPTAIDEALKNRVEPLSTYKQAQIDQLNVKRAELNKANKGSTQITSQRMSLWEIVDGVKTLSTVNLIDGFGPDSLLSVSSANGNAAVSIHATSMVTDVTSASFGIISKNFFAPVDDYTVDSVSVVGIYDIRTPNLTGATGDKIRVDVIWGAPTNNTTWRTGVSFPANTWPGQSTAIQLAVPRYQGTTNHLFHNGLQAAASNRITLEYNLTVADSANVEWVLPVPSGAIPAGAKVAVVAHFVPGYTYALGDVAYNFSGTSTPTKNSWRPIYIYDENNVGTGSTPTFLEAFDLNPNSFSGCQFLLTDSRYGIAAQAFINELMSPTTAFSPFFEIVVSGTSTVGVNEINKPKFAVYPNPTTTGEVKIRTANIVDGNYDLKVLNMLGQVVKSESIFALNGEEYSVDLNGLGKGIYLINLSNNSNVNITERVTVK